MLRALAVRLRSLFRHRTVEADLDQELQYHLDRDAERLVAQGMDPSAARDAARRSFGNVQVLKEASRDARGVRLLEHLGRDCGAGLRLARRQPGFATVVVLSLALGLGATTAIFNLTYNVLLAPLALPHPEQLTAVVRTSGDKSDDAFTWEEYQALRATPGVGSLAAQRTASQITIAYGASREYVNMHFVDGAYFPMLGLRPLAGRLITPTDDRRQMTVAVLSERFARTLFGDSSAVGRNITIRGAPFTVVGVTPRSFRGLEYPGQFTAAIPLSTMPLLAAAGSREDDRGTPLDLATTSGSPLRAYRVVGRLALDRPVAARALDVTFARCCVRPDARERITLLDIRRGIAGGKDDFRNTIGAILMILLAGMALVLAVVCTNIASLLLVRTTGREREIALRLSLGAARGRVVSQLLLETLPLSLAGGVFGLFVASWITRALVVRVPEWDVYLDMLRLRLEPQVLLFAGAITLLCGVAFAVYPALRATRGDLAPALGQGGRASRGRRQGAVARGVVVAQVALTVVLVTAATLFAVTLRNLGHVDGGFATDRVLLVSIESRGTPYEPGGVGLLHQPLLEAAGALPGVRSAAMASMIPLFGGNMSSLNFAVPGYEPAPGEHPWARLDAVAPGFFATLGIPVLEGRDFTRADGAMAEPVAIVSATFARRYFGGRAVVGRSFRATLHGDSLTPARIVGVAADAKYESLRDDPEALVYVPLAQTPLGWNSLLLAVRTAAAPLALVSAVRRALDAAAPGIRLRRVSEMRAQVAVSTAMERLAAELAGCAGLVAIALSMIGLYGVVAHGVARRTRELGIRLALGAQSLSIIWLVMRDIATILGIGLVFGLVLSFGASGALRAQLYGVGAHDLAVTAVSVSLLAAAALLATLVPAARAVRIDPRLALLAE
jgi:putative ABC transport system permease protein